jgi:hypothetical protein
MTMPATATSVTLVRGDRATIVLASRDGDTHRYELCGDTDELLALAARRLASTQ